MIRDNMAGLEPPEEGPSVLPKDPFILLSVVNTKLRDEYGSFAELCAALGEDPRKIREILAALDRRYDPERNQFI